VYACVCMFARLFLYFFFFALVVQVVAAKAAVIARTPQLAAALGEGAQASAEGVSSSCYNLVAGQAAAAVRCGLCDALAPPPAADIRDCAAMELQLLKVHTKGGGGRRLCTRFPDLLPLCWVFVQAGLTRDAPVLFLSECVLVYLQVAAPPLPPPLHLHPVHLVSRDRLFVLGGSARRRRRYCAMGCRVRERGGGGRVRHVRADPPARCIRAGDNE
jgi:hypothetical protein